MVAERTAKNGWGSTSPSRSGRAWKPISRLLDPSCLYVNDDRLGRAVASQGEAGSRKMSPRSLPAKVIANIDLLLIAAIGVAMLVIATAKVRQPEWLQPQDIAASDIQPWAGTDHQ